MQIAVQLLTASIVNLDSLALLLLPLLVEQVLMPLEMLLLVLIVLRATIAQIQKLHHSSALLATIPILQRQVAPNASSVTCAPLLSTQRNSPVQLTTTLLMAGLLVSNVPWELLVPQHLQK